MGAFLYAVADIKIRHFFLRTIAVGYPDAVFRELDEIEAKCFKLLRMINQINKELA
ncbi:hypothetical protein BX283_5778 [Streptomyces sp. TLI_146]|nr:hypothetical protein BX283_5778 [Streptomyces sp. TLI_146]